MIDFLKFVIGFTKGWRRRLGIRMLILASILTGGWIRSLSCYDEFRFHTATDRTDALISTDSSIGWEKRTGFEFLAAPSLSFMEFFPGNPFVDIPGSSPQNSRWDWHWYRYGIGSGSAVYGRGNETKFEHRTVWIIPYWSIVGPLIAVSAWLLVTSRQRASSDQVAAPVTEAENRSR